MSNKPILRPTPERPDWLQNAPKRAMERARRFFKRDRIMRETRLERGGLKWLQKNAVRANKHGRRGETADQARERLLLELRGSSVANPECPPPVLDGIEGRGVEQKLPELVDERRWHYCSADLDREEGGLVYTCSNCGTSIARRECEVQEGKDWLNVSGGGARHACAPEDRGEDALVLFDRENRSTRLTPVERGSLVPTAREYAMEVIPAYVETGEELERTLELQRAREELEEAIERRNEEGAGPAPCEGVALFSLGHRWRKVPGSPIWFCIGCGREAGTLRYELVRGHLSPIRPADPSELRRASSMIAEMRSAHGPQVIDGEAPGRRVLREAAALLDLSAPFSTEFKGQELDPEVCSICGSPKALHVHERRLGRTTKGRPRIQYRLFCPRDGVDVT